MGTELSMSLIGQMDRRARASGWAISGPQVQRSDRQLDSEGLGGGQGKPRGKRTERI